MRTRSDAGHSEVETDQLVHEIAEKAEGVFLWIVLVVKSVCSGISEGDTVSFLRYRVQCFPSDLEDFFRNTLGRVDSAYKHQTNQALKLAWLYTHDTFIKDSINIRGRKSSGVRRPTANPSEGGSYISGAPCPSTGPSFVDYWLIRQDPRGLANANFAYDGDVTNLSCETSSRMADETQIFLSAACKDLLYIPSWKKARDHAHVCLTQQVQFLHRTVYDFLSTPEMQTILDEVLPSHFKDGRVQHLLNLRRLKYVLCGDLCRARLRNLEGTAAKSLTTTHHDLSQDFVKEFDRVASTHLIACRRQLSEYEDHFSWTADRVLATFIAFRQHKSVFEILDQRRERPDLDDCSLDVSYKDEIWTAALGELPINTFSRADMDPQLIGKLLQHKYWRG